jgi:CRISPR-associated exonuclease Cas4
MNLPAVPEPRDFSFRVIDLKQYTYCPRIAYYHIVLPAVRPVTYHMESGIAQHRLAEDREKRRSLRTYGLSAGERFFNVPLWSPELGLTGELDMLIETGTERIPVDYKDSDRVGAHFKLQVMAYGRLLEVTGAATDKPVRRGFIYLIPLRKAIEVPFTRGIRHQLDRTVHGIRMIAGRETVPAPTTHRRRCIDCEFRRFCNDI